MSYSSNDVVRAVKIAQDAIESGRNPTDTAGMDTDDEEWIDGDGHEDLVLQVYEGLQKKTQERVSKKIPKEQQIKQEYEIPRTHPLNKSLQTIAKRFFVKQETLKKGTYPAHEFKGIQEEYDYLTELYDPQVILCRLIAMGFTDTVEVIVDDGFVPSGPLNQLHDLYPKEYVCKFSEEFSLNEEIDVNQSTDSFGNSPLVTAVEYRHADIVRELLQKGAKPDLEDDNGDTAQEILDTYKPSEKSVKSEIQALLDDARQKQASKKKKKTKRKYKRSKKKNQ